MDSVGEKHPGLRQRVWSDARLSGIGGSSLDKLSPNRYATIQPRILGSLSVTSFNAFALSPSAKCALRLLKFCGDIPYVRE